MNESIAQAWWFILLGYLSFFIYSFAIMLLSIIIEKKTKIDKLICRKVTHIISAFVWVISWFFFGCSIQWVIANGIGAISLAFVTFGKGFAVYERNDANKSYGLFYFGISTFFVALTCYLVHALIDDTLGMQLYYAAGIAYFCLALGDGFAPIIVSLLPKHNPMLVQNRSLFGTATVFAVSLISTMIFSAVFKLQLSFFFMLSIAALTCISELYGIKGLDNIMIDVFVFSYVALYYLGAASPVFQLVVVLSPMLACLALLSGSLSYSGGVATLVLFYLIGYFSSGRYLPILYIGLMFLLASVSSVITKKLKKRRGVKLKSSHARTGSQVLAVGAVAVVSLILHDLTKQPIFNLLYYLCIAEQFADSISSDWGYFTKGNTIDLVRGKPIPKGISGGVSLLGTILALVSAVLLLLVPFFLDADMNAVCYAVAVVIAFMGTMLDSAFGSLLQACYSCPQCGALTETENHCGKAAVLIKGYACVKNVTVNFFASVGSFLLGLLLLVVI